MTKLHFSVLYTASETADEGMLIIWYRFLPWAFSKIDYHLYIHNRPWPELCDEALNRVISTHIASIICLPSAGAWSLQQIIAIRLWLQWGQSPPPGGINRKPMPGWQCPCCSWYCIRLLFACIGQYKEFNTLDKSVIWKVHLTLPDCPSMMNSWDRRVNYYATKNC